MLNAQLSGATEWTMRRLAQSPNIETHALGLGNASILRNILETVHLSCIDPVMAKWLASAASHCSVIYLLGSGNVTLSLLIWARARMIVSGGTSLNLADSSAALRYGCLASASFAAGGSG